MDFDKKQEPLQEVTDFDIENEKRTLKMQFSNSAEMDAVTSQIDAYDVNSIVSFGGDAAHEISKCSDTILNSINMSQVNDSGELLNTLGKIMDKFDLNEIRSDEKKGLFGKLFGNIQKQIDQLLAKYNTMGAEVDKIYVKLKEYESEIKNSNNTLEKLFQTNSGYYRQLLKYIFAGEQGVKEIDEHIKSLRMRHENTPDAMLMLDIDTLEQSRNLLEQRVMDLKMAENVAMQSMPMIRSMQYGNLNLIRKINSAFIVTLPVFKQALTQAILLKRQRVQAEAMQALDQRTNEMLLRNAENTAEQTKMTARLASGSSIKIETLEQTWKTIMNGIEETRRIEEDARKKRGDDTVRLNQLKEEFVSKFPVIPK